MKTLRTLKNIFKLAIKEGLLPTMGIHVFILLIHTSLTIYQLEFEKNLVNKIFNIQNETIGYLILYILLFFLIKNFLNILYQIRFFIAAAFGPIFAQNLRDRMYDKITHLNLIYFEDVELYNLIEKAKRAYHFSVTSFSNAYQSLFGHVFSVIGIGIYLTTLNPFFILIILLSTVPKILTFSVKGKRKLQLENDQAPIRRQVVYYDDCMTDKKYYKETRLLGSVDYFKLSFDKALKSLQELEWKNVKKLISMEFILYFFNFLSYVGPFLLAIYFLYQGDISIGSFAAVLSALTVLDLRVGKIVRNTGQIIEEAAIASNYFTFLELDENNGHKKENIKDINEITFDHVSFTYPSLKHLVINDMNLSIHKGETIAIVGLNGSGKTTFVKLLLGLLNPVEGKIFYDGMDISTVDSECLHKRSSALFQTFAKYQMTIKENVAVSDHERTNEKDEIVKSLDFVKFKFDERLKLETKLGKEFGGTDLSGGQWQLLALARAYFRKNQLIVLDEPTAAIDPILEDEIFQNFRLISKNKTAIIVTHRLGVSKIADRILVFEKGQIIEDGSHETLMKNRGHYFNMYSQQKNWYERDSIR